MVKISECPFCDSFDFSEITVNHFFCRDCGEKWIEEEYVPPYTICDTCGDDHSFYVNDDEFYDDELVLKYMKGSDHVDSDDSYIRPISQ